MRRSRIAGAGLLALLACLATACGEEPGAPAGRPDEAGRIVGRWVSKPTLSQLGEIVHSFEFRPDGTWHGSFDFVQAPFPTVTVDGTYDAGARTFGSDRMKETMTWTFDGAVLVLREANGDTYRLERR